METITAAEWERRLAAGEAREIGRRTRLVLASGSATEGVQTWMRVRVIEGAR